MSPEAKKFTPQRMEVEDAPGVSPMGDLSVIDTLWCALEAAVLKMGGSLRRPCRRCERQCWLSKKRGRKPSRCLTRRL
eukprot:4929959-Prymnesium_polylepis.1